MNNDDILGKIENDIDKINNDVITAKSITNAIFIQDHSGSMSTKTEETINSFNEQIQSLQDEARDGHKVFVTVLEFDNIINESIVNEDVHNIKPMEKYWTRGMTALYDTIIRGIVKGEEWLKDNEGIENRAVLLIIQTDGEENSSVEYSKMNKGTEKIKEKIKELEKQDCWTIVFLGEGLKDDDALNLGVFSTNTMCYKSDERGNAYNMTTEGIKHYMNARKTGAKSVYDFYKEEK